MPGRHSGRRILRAGMAGMGMIFEETYRPVFEQLREEGLFTRATGWVEVELAATATRTGLRARRYLQEAGARLGPFEIFTGPDAARGLARADVDFICVATPDPRHYEVAAAALEAGKHVLIEKPSVLQLAHLDHLVQLAQSNEVLARVVYHKLLDPDHKKLRTLVADGVLKHVNNGYCSLLEPKRIALQQFAEWIRGRNPGTYVAVHYIKLIDFTFGGRLTRVLATGQRGLVGPADGDTWDSIQLRLEYRYEDGREAAFDIHTSWVTPDNFPGYVEQEVQFRFDNGVWSAHQRRRGVEVTVEGKSLEEFKLNLNNHYSTEFLEPWGKRSRRGYGLEAIRRFVEEVAYVEFGGPPEQRTDRLREIQSQTYADLSADRPVVAVVQAMEAILSEHAQGRPGAMVRVNGPEGGLVLYRPGCAHGKVLYEGEV
jgi:D-galacturonate reductase